MPLISFDPKGHKNIKFNLHANLPLWVKNLQGIPWPFMAAKWMGVLPSALH